MKTPLATSRNGVYPHKTFGRRLEMPRPNHDRVAKLTDLGAAALVVSALTLGVLLLLVLALALGWGAVILVQDLAHRLSAS